MSKRKFEVEVTRVDKYTITIDEDNIESGLIEEYEKTSSKLNDKDKIKDLAEKIGFMAMDNNNDFYEGVGYIKKDGICYGQDIVKGIEIKSDFIEHYETDITEVK